MPFGIRSVETKISTIQHYLKEENEAKPRRVEDANTIRVKMDI